LEGATDNVKPWTIRAMPNEVRNLALAMAREEGITVAQWLERTIRRLAAEGREGGRPGPASAPMAIAGPAPGDLAGIERIAAAVRGLAEAGLPVPKAAARQVVAALVAQLPASGRQSRRRRSDTAADMSDAGAVSSDSP